MARSNTDCKTELNLKIKAGLIASFCLLSLAITVVSLMWLLDIYYMQEPCAKIIHKEVHFLLGVVVCIFLNSIAFYFKGKKIITTKKKKYNNYFISVVCLYHSYLYG